MKPELNISESAGLGKLARKSFPVAGVFSLASRAIGEAIVDICG
jgi:hypothetical protein